jgi:hypothetical protein
VSRFEVDVPVVDALSGSVVAAGSQARSVLGQVNGAGCVDAGDAGLGAALSVFGQVWGSFTQAAAQAVDATGGAISVAAAAYQRVDGSVIADPGVTAAFVAEVAAGGDGQAALGRSTGSGLRGPR